MFEWWTNRQLGVVLWGSENGVVFLRLSRQQLLKMCRGFWPGYKEQVWRILDAGFEAPVRGMTLVTRQRQLHDEDKSCGTQPAYIRVICRRICPCALTGIHGVDNDKEKN